MAQVEAKVTASTAAAAASGLILWAAGRYVFKGSVPDVVVSWVYVIIPSVITFLAGYAAKHTSRPGVPLPLVARPFPAEKTLIPPAAAAVEPPPAAAGPEAT